MKKLVLATVLMASAFAFLAVAGAGSAAADTGSLTWGGQGFPNATCNDNPQTMLWVFTDNAASSATLTVNGVDYGAMDQQGGGAFQLTIPFVMPVSASVSYTFDAPDANNAVLTLSGCNEGGTTTPPPTTTTPPPPTTTPPPPTTTTPPPTTTTPPPVHTTPTTTTVPPVTGTTTTAPPPPPNNNNNNQPPTHFNASPNKPEKATPLAFTGAEDVLPLGAVALALLGSGGSLFYLGRRRNRWEGK